MAAPDMNGRLQLTDVHQDSPASLLFFHIRLFVIEDRTKRQKTVQRTFLLHEEEMPKRVLEKN